MRCSRRFVDTNERGQQRGVRRASVAAMIAFLSILGSFMLAMAACALVAWLVRVRRRVLGRRAWQERQAVAPWWN
jgi:hypothetical protein